MTAKPTMATADDTVLTIDIQKVDFGRGGVADPIVPARTRRGPRSTSETGSSRRTSSGRRSINVGGGRVLSRAMSA